MQEDLISFETAKLAKEKKFNIPCENFYIEYIDDDVADLFNYEEQRGSGYAELYRNNQEFKYSASTQSLLQKWLREVYKIDCFPEHVFLGESANIKYKPLITTGIDDIDSEKYCNYSFGNVYDTYEQAFEFGLQEALKLINN